MAETETWNPWQNIFGSCSSDCCDSRKVQSNRSSQIARHYKASVQGPTGTQWWNRSTIDLEKLEGCKVEAGVAYLKRVDPYEGLARPKFDVAPNKIFPEVKEKREVLNLEVKEKGQVLNLENKSFCLSSETEVEESMDHGSRRSSTNSDMALMSRKSSVTFHQSTGLSPISKSRRTSGFGIHPDSTVTDDGKWIRQPASS